MSGFIFPEETTSVKVDAAQEPSSFSSSTLSLSTTKQSSNRWQISKFLGDGTFGKVYTGIPSQLGAPLVALKVIENSRCDMREEIAVMRYVSENISNTSLLRLYDVFHNNLYETTLVVELLSGGELFYRLVQKPFSEKDASTLMKQVCSGLADLHEHGIVHLDVKPENLVFEDSSHTILKILDFGEDDGIRFSCHSIFVSHTHTHSLSDVGFSYKLPKGGSWPVAFPKYRGCVTILYLSFCVSL